MQIHTRKPAPLLQRSKLARFVAIPAFAGLLVLFLAGPILFPGNKALYDAIERGEAARVRRLLASGVDPDSRSRPLFDTVRTQRYVSPPLAYALWRNQPAIALLLLDAGADPNVRHPGGETALMIAATAGHTEVVRALLEKGADVHATLGGATALRHGDYNDRQVRALKPEIERLLREAGAR